MIVAINNPVDARGDFPSFDVGSEASRKIITESRLLRFVKQKSLVQILKGVLGNPYFGHCLPIDPLTDSQSRSCAAPSRTLARRRSKRSFCSSESPNRSNRSRKSSQMASMIWIFRSIGSALISSKFMVNSTSTLAGTPLFCVGRAPDSTIQRLPTFQQSLNLHLANHFFPRESAPFDQAFA